MRRKIARIIRAVRTKRNDARIITSSTVVIAGSLSTVTILICSCCTGYASTISESDAASDYSKTTAFYTVVAALNQALTLKDDS